MNEILNKEYKRKNTIGSDIFVPMSIDENNFVIFANGAKCKMETFVTDFELNINNIASDSLNTINETINPDTFFDAPSTTVHDPLLDQLEKVMKDPNSIQPSEKLMQSESLDHIGTGLENRIAEPSTHGTPQVYNSPLDDLKPQTKRLPEYDVFDRVKKAEEIEINIPVIIKLPRPEKIDALNDMFETSFTSYLAKQFVDDYIIKNSKQIENQIQEQIEIWMESELYDNKPKRKPVKKTVKKSNLKTTDALELVPVQAMDMPDTIIPAIIPINAFSDVGDLLRNNGKPSKPWDGNLKTLITINSEEQYNAVKKKYDYLIENDPQHADVERFEGLIELYTQQ